MATSRNDPRPARRARTGERLVLEVGEAAQGGHCVARLDGQVVFVRHAIPGESVVAEVTGSGSGGRFLRADAIEVLEASPDRREAPCPYAGAGQCGGCDWQHVVPDARRALLSGAVTTVMRRIGGLDSDVEVLAVPGDADGLRWRTRVRYSVTAEGRLGLHRHRSASVRPVERCLLATEAVAATGVTSLPWPRARSVSVVASSGGDVAVLIDAEGRERQILARQLPREVAVPGVRGSTRVSEVVDGRRLLVAAAGFWQSHHAAPELLVDAVRAALAPQDGEHLVDLYSGAGLFATSLAGAVGEAGRVDSVEIDESGCAAARRNVHDLPQVRVHRASVDQWLTDPDRSCDLVVLDPPESGAGRVVVERIDALRPRRIAYVSCGPASLARDLSDFRSRGWDVESVTAYELFPSTQHVECVAVLARARSAR